MAKSNRQTQIGNNKHTGHLPAQKVTAVTQTIPVAVKQLSGLNANLIAIAGIVIVTYLVLKVSLLNQFTNWDDPGYVVNNPVIKDMTADGLKKIFSTPVMGNYHPLTILTYAVDYSWVTLEPYLYHLDSLLFHIATTVLVFCFVLLLTKRRIAAIITALLFGIHPMHVESVAWVAGRKDVVYGLFYMAALIAYLFFVRKTSSKKWTWYIAVLISFLCSLLSKPVAVILPVTLVLIDFYEGNLIDVNNRRILFKSLLNKIPFFLISAGFGWRSLIDQRVFGALGTQADHYSFIERIGLGGYALITYLWKAIAPVKLLCFYPYPLKENGSLPVFYYIYPVLAAVMVLGILWLAKKNKAVIFGVLFFLVNIALLLQFIPVGGAIIADRYSYIPYLGLFFALGWIVAVLYEHNRQMGKLALAAVIAYGVGLGYLSNERCKVWYDGMSLWRDEIEVEPIRAPNGYNNLGFFYFSKFNNSVNPAERKIYYDSSYFLLTKAIQLQATFVNPYISLGELLRANGQFEEAKVYYYKALKLDTNDQAANAYLGLAIVYSIAQRVDSANFCYAATLRLHPYNPEAHSNYANFLDMTGHPDAAIVQYGVAIGQNPDIIPPYLNRGRAYQRMGKCDEAFKDFERVISLNPDMGEVYYARSKCFIAKGNKAQAIQDVNKARSLGFTNMDPTYLETLK